MSESEIKIKGLGMEKSRKKSAHRFSSAHAGDRNVLRGSNQMSSLAFAHFFLQIKSTNQQTF